MLSKDSLPAIIEAYHLVKQAEENIEKANRLWPSVNYNPVKEAMRSYANYICQNFGEAVLRESNGERNSICNRG